jgi:hypothetical protein
MVPVPRSTPGTHRSTPQYPRDPAAVMPHSSRAERSHAFPACASAAQCSDQPATRRCPSALRSCGRGSAVRHKDAQRRAAATAFRGVARGRFGGEVVDFDGIDRYTHARTHHARMHAPRSRARAHTRMHACARAHARKGTQARTRTRKCARAHAHTDARRQAHTRTRARTHAQLLGVLRRWGCARPPARRRAVEGAHLLRTAPTPSATRTPRTVRCKPASRGPFAKPAQAHGRPAEACGRPAVAHGKPGIVAASARVTAGAPPGQRRGVQRRPPVQVGRGAASEEEAQAQRGPRQREPRQRGARAESARRAFGKRE